MNKKINTNYKLHLISSNQYASQQIKCIYLPTHNKSDFINNKYDMVHTFIRPATLEDLPLLHLCFEASVSQTCCNDYNTEQINAWINKATLERWQELFDSDLHFIVAEDRATKHIAGFTSINSIGYLHSMFVHPLYQQQGVAKQLLQVAETFAIQSQTTSIHSEVSLTAKSFFAKMGYVCEEEQAIVVNQVVMTNFLMRKQLSPSTKMD